MTTHPTLADLQNEATWLERRSLIPEPLFSSGMVTTDQSRAEFLEGARLLRIDQLRNYAGEKVGPTPIQLAVADTIASGRKMNAILEPRRTTKTTSIQAVLMGRCSLGLDYLVGWTVATTGAKAGERFKKDIAAPLARLYPDPRTRPFKIELSKGGEGLVWPGSGSYFNVYSPNGDGFRSNAFDAAWVDEGGEAEIELGEDLTAAIRPTLHTRADAQFIISGTAASFRQGNLLWDALNDPRAAVLRHGIPDDIDPAQLEAWEPDAEHPEARVRELVELSHPGIGWTTPLDAIQDDWDTPAMRKNFAAEILSVFGSEGSNVALISQPKWTAAALPLTAAGTGAPTRFALAAVVSPSATVSAIGAAWVGRDKKVHVGLLHHQAGVDGFRQKALLLSRKHKRTITYDGGSAATAVEIQQLREARPKPTERVLVTRDISKAAVNLLNLLNADRLRHHDQAELNAAVEVATKRAIGSYGGWGFGGPRGQEDYDIVGLEAVAQAALVLDQERTAGTGDLAGAIGFFD